MSNIWCRLHVETLHDVKVQRLSPELFKAWINMLLIAKLHDGVLPDLGTVAYHLHLTEQKAGALVGKLAAAELLDAVPGGYYEPHNWHERQYVNKNDPTAAERNKRHRKNKRERERNGYGGVTAVTVTAPEQSKADTEVDDEDDARARPPLISPEANRLADECAKIAGHDPSFVPPSWCGAAYRTQTWINQGWPAHLVLESVKAQAAKKRDGPAKSIQYFEPGIASAIAKANQPLPNVVEIPAKTVEVERGKAQSQSSGILAAADRLIETIEGWGTPSPAALGCGADAPDVRLLSERGRERSGGLHGGGGRSAGGVRPGRDLPSDGPEDGTSAPDKIFAESGGGR